MTEATERKRRQLNLRLDGYPEVDEALREKAREADVSIHEFVITAIKAALGMKVSNPNLLAPSTNLSINSSTNVSSINVDKLKTELEEALATMVTERVAEIQEKLNRELAQNKQELEHQLQAAKLELDSKLQEARQELEEPSPKLAA